MLDRFLLPEAPERIAFAHKLLYVLAGAGLFVAPVEYANGNSIVMWLGLAGAVVIPALLWLSAKIGSPRLPIWFALGFLTFMALLGATTQMHSLSNLVWILLFPFAFFYLAGLPVGALLAALVFLSLAVFYWAYPMLHVQQPVPFKQFTQLLLAYLTAAAIAYYYELLRARHDDQLRFLSEKDFLTGLANRRGFFVQAANILTQAKRFHQPFCIVLIDVDDFKAINDTRGHEAGDAVLRCVAEIIMANTRAYDLAGRWGGEEFILLISQCAAEGGASLAEKVRHALAEFELPCGGRITASFGVAVHDGEEGIESVIRRADAQLYRAKATGKNRISLDPASLQLTTQAI